MLSARCNVCTHRLVLACSCSQGHSRLHPQLIAWMMHALRLSACLLQCLELAMPACVHNTVQQPSSRLQSRKVWGSFARGVLHVAVSAS